MNQNENETQTQNQNTINDNIKNSNINTNEKSKKPKHRNKNTKRNIIITICIILLTIFILFFISTKNTHKSNIIQGNLPSMTQSEIQKGETKKQTDMDFTVKVEPQGSIVKDSNILKLGIANVFYNKQNCIVQILENEKVLYTSEKMAPKTYMIEIPLNNKLSVGNHKLTVRYNVYVKDQKIGSADVKTNVISK